VAICDFFLQPVVPNLGASHGCLYGESFALLWSSPATA